MKNERSLVYYLIITCLFCLFASSCSQKMETTSFTAMNTYMTVKAYGENSKLLAATNYLIQQEVEWLELTLSTTIEGSDIYKINVSAENERTGFVENSVHPETAYLITRSRELYERTGGAFNPALYPLIKEWGFTTGEYKVPSEERILRLLEYTDFSKVEISGRKTSPELILFPRLSSPILPECSWTLVPLEKAMPATRLLSFYERLMLVQPYLTLAGTFRFWEQNRTEVTGLWESKIPGAASLWLQ